MTLTKEQVQWVEATTGVLTKTSDWKLAADQKAELLAQVRRELDGQRKELQELLKFSLKLKDGGKIFSSLGDSREDWAVDDEIDSVHDVRNLAEGLPIDIQKRAMRAIDALNGFSTRLENGGFTAKEVRVEFWDPLKREGICPDNLIPDKFNETVQVFQEADKFYQERIAKENEKTLKNQNWADAKFGLDKATTIVSSLNSAFGGPELLTTISDFAGTMGKATLTIVEGVVEKDCQSVADAVGDLLKEVIKAAGVRDDKIAVLIQKSYTLALDAGKLGKAAAEKDPKEFFSALGDAVADGMAVMDRGNREETPWGSLGTKINAGIQASVDLTAAGVAIKNRDWAGLTEVAESAVSRSVSMSLSISGVIEKKGEQVAEGKAESSKAKGKPMTEEQVTNYGLNKAEDIEDKIEGIVGETGPLSKAFANIKKVGDFEELEKEINAKEAKKLQDELAKELDPENHDFENELTKALEAANMAPGDLDKLGKDAKEEAINSIERMIQKIEKVRATLKIAEAIFDAGMKTAAEFVEPLKMATAGKDFIKNVILAVKQGVELNQWIDEVERAATAASVYGKTFANRVKNLRVQISEKTAHAVCDLLKVVGGGLTCGAITAPAGLVVGKVATAAQAISDVAFEIGKRTDAKLQWNKYRECLELPPHMSDRKLMREILHGNPTLSKYALAYGAVIEKDRIAIVGMKLCGITEENLNEEGTNVKLVVKYLESKFDEDPVLVKQIPEQAWQTKSDTISLTTFKDDLEKAASATGFINEKTGAIEGYFGQYVTLKIDYETTRKKQREQREGYLPERKKLEAAEREFVGARNTYDRALVLYQEALLGFRNLEKNEEAKGKEPEFRKEYRGSMNVFLGHAEQLQRKAVACEDLALKAHQAASDHESHARKYLPTLESHLNKRDEYSTSLRRFSNELKKYSPRKNKENPEPDDSVRDFLDALMQKVLAAKDDAESDDPSLQDAKEEVERFIAGLDQVQRERTTTAEQAKKNREESAELSVILNKKLPDWQDV